MCVLLLSTVCHSSGLVANTHHLWKQHTRHHRRYTLAAAISSARCPASLSAAAAPCAPSVKLTCCSSTGNATKSHKLRSTQAHERMPDPPPHARTPSAALPPASSTARRLWADGGAVILMSWGRGANIMPATSWRCTGVPQFSAPKWRGRLTAAAFGQPETEAPADGDRPSCRWTRLSSRGWRWEGGLGTRHGFIRQQTGKTAWQTQAESRREPEGEGRPRARVCPRLRRPPGPAARARRTCPRAPATSSPRRHHTNTHSIVTAIITPTLHRHVIITTLSRHCHGNHHAIITSKSPKQSVRSFQSAWLRADPVGVRVCCWQSADVRTGACLPPAVPVVVRAHTKRGEGRVLFSESGWDNPTDMPMRHNARCDNTKQEFRTFFEISGAPTSSRSLKTQTCLAAKSGACEVHGTASLCLTPPFA